MLTKEEVLATILGAHADLVAGRDSLAVNQLVEAAGVICDREAYAENDLDREGNPNWVAVPVDPYTLVNAGRGGRGPRRPRHGPSLMDQQVARSARYNAP